MQEVALHFHCSDWSFTGLVCMICVQYLLPKPVFIKKTELFRSVKPEHLYAKHC